MTDSLNIQLALEDLLADLNFARKNDQLGRLALLAYCEVKGWARLASKPDLADTTLEMFSQNPCVSKVEFLQSIDTLIRTLQLHDNEYRRKNAQYAGTVSISAPIRIHS